MLLIAQTAGESQMVCVHTRQQGGIAVIWKVSEWEEDHIQWMFAFYLEVATFHQRTLNSASGGEESCCCLLLFTVSFGFQFLRL